MRTKKFIVFFFIALGLACRAFSQTSHIQVVSEAGISIFLDGQFKGTTSSEYGGLIIQNVSSGQHTIKVVKEEYLPREESVNVKAGEVFTYQVNKNFIPAIKISEQGNKDNQALSIKQGKLKLQSLPIGINISIPSLNINQAKEKDEWMAEPIPEGSYPATFTLNGKVLSDVLEIQNDMITYAFVNMISGKIENKSITPINITNVIAKPSVDYRNRIFNLTDVDIKPECLPNDYFVNNTPQGDIDTYIVWLNKIVSSTWLISKDHSHKVSFCITENGTVEDIVSIPVDYKTGQVNQWMMMERWNPATKDGVPVKVRIENVILNY